MSEKVLESVVTKVRPLVDEAMQKYLGVTVSEIEEDITDKIKQNPLIDFLVNTNISFKQAKNEFKRFYLLKLLKMHQGNISEVAIVSNIERETIHRLIKKFKINIDRLRQESENIDYIKEAAIKDIIQKSVETYKSSLNPEKIKTFYRQTPALSKDIAKEIPEIRMTFKQAEQEFEKSYINKALEENNSNISQTARKIGLRFETLHRKIRKLGII